MEQKFNKNNIACIGLSHLGVVVSLGLSSLGKHIIAVDENSERIKILTSGELPVYEPGLNEILLKTKVNYHPTIEFSAISQAKVIFFTLDTPYETKKALKELDGIIDKAIPYLVNGVVLVVMSQVPVGFCRQLVKEVRNKKPKLKFSLYYWVNTIVVGESIERFLKPERIIIGTDDSPKRNVSKILADIISLFKCPVFNMSYESAEMSKMAVNLFLSSSITTANALSDLCENIGADINQIIPILQTDKRIGPHAYLRPTIRIAGGHLERELERFILLRKRYKLKPTIIDYISKLNADRYKWIERLLKGYLPKTKKKETICLWGLTYKKNTTSTQNSVSLEIIKSLSKKFKIQAYDPLAIMPKIHGYKRYNDKYMAVNEADCLLILTEWGEFQQVKTKKLKTLMNYPLIIDTVGILNHKRDKLKDFNYISMGAGHSVN